MEIRFLAALLISKYKFTFAPGDDGLSVVRDAKDNIALVPGPLNLVFEPR